MGVPLTASSDFILPSITSDSKLLKILAFFEVSDPDFLNKLKIDFFFLTDYSVGNFSIGYYFSS